MVVSVEHVARKYLDVTAGTPISVDIPAFETSDIYVYYGDASILASMNADYTLTLAEDFNTFVVTPLTALIDKINALIAADPTETNFITVRRALDYQTDATPANVRYTPYTSKEFDRAAMRDAQLAEKLNRALVLAPGFVGDVPRLEMQELLGGRLLQTNADSSAIEMGEEVSALKNALAMLTALLAENGVVPADTDYGLITNSVTLANDWGAIS